MKKTELLKFMDKEQLIKVVNSMIDENKNLENQLKESEATSQTRLSRIKSLELTINDEKKELRQVHKRSWENKISLESIAREVNKSTTFFKDQEKNELLTFKNCSNIIDRLQDRFDINEDGLFICNLTKKPF